MTDYLTMAEVLAIHSDQIERYRGSPGVRDHGLLEAAARWGNFVANHPLIDGNKRTAFAATYTFLAINGVRLTAGAWETCVFRASLY